MEKDISQLLAIRGLLVQDITSDTDTFSPSVDTQNIQGGLMFAVSASAYTDGTYAVSFQKADDTGFTVNVNDIPAAQIVGAIADITAAQVVTELPKAGILSLKDPSTLQDQRFVRVKITSTGTTTGASILVVSTEKLDEAP